MPIIAMTKEMGSLGTFIGIEVAKELGYEFIRQDIIREAAREYHALEEKIVEAVEEKPGFFEMFTETARRHHIFVAAEVYESALRERVVIMGRWSTLLLKEVHHAVKIRVCAPLDVRIRRVIERLSIGEAEAHKRIRHYDEGVSSRIRQFFDAEWADPLLYDLTINTANVSLATGVAQVKKLIEAPEFQATDTSLRGLQNLAMAARVRATLKSHRQTARLDVDIVGSDGEVTLRGIVPEALDRQEVERIAKTVPEVRSVKSELIALEEHRRL
ncbi:MAG: cytidylate kinase family protein [Candidatus Methylomirabilales bacterium]